MMKNCAYIAIACLLLLAAFTPMPPCSELVVHGRGPAYYDARNVPHGAVTRHVHHSNVTNGEREFYAHTPPGYDRSKRDPALYLSGASGELPSNWIYDKAHASGSQVAGDIPTPGAPSRYQGRRQ